MNWDAAHRNGPAIMFAAGGECDIKRCRGRASVVEEQLEKIAHPVKEQAVACLGLQTQILHHHRCRFAIPRHISCVSEGETAGQCLPLSRHRVRAV